MIRCFFDRFIRIHVIPLPLHRIIESRPIVSIDSLHPHALSISPIPLPHHYESFPQLCVSLCYSDPSIESPSLV